MLRRPDLWWHTPEEGEARFGAEGDSAGGRAPGHHVQGDGEGLLLPMSTIQAQMGVASPTLREAVLFPFDDTSLPFSAGLRLQLVGGKTPGRKNPIVLRRGEPGDPDDARVRFYGTVIPIDGELRMWYLARGSLDENDRDGGQLRACYAVSRDGVHWEKPALGKLRAPRSVLRVGTDRSPVPTDSRQRTADSRWAFLRRSLP